MKKMFFTLSVLMFAVIAGFSQVTFKPALGMSFNNFSDESNGESKAKIGAQIGAGLAFGKKFYIEPGVYYATKSTEFTIINDPVVPDFDAIIKGIRVPVAIGFGLLGNEKSFITLRAFGGASGFFVTGTGDDLDKDNVESPTWGAFAGAGFDFWIAFVEASYEWSLNNSLRNIEVGKSQTFFITAGLKF
jgi:hypothetical protein